MQEIKKEAIKNVSDSEGRVDFAIGLMNSDLPYGKVKFFFREFKNFRRTVINTNQFFLFLAPVEMTFRIVL